ncbi:hypothetical protein Tco_0358551 [Tanacetum coccineum]
MSTVNSTNGNVLLGSNKNSSSLTNPGGASTDASGNSDDGATIADGAGKMGAVRISGIEAAGDTYLSGISVSNSESSKHRKGETIGATDTGSNTPKNMTMQRNTTWGATS